MARRAADENQMQLIEVDSPETKAAKRHAIGYLRLCEANNGERAKMRSKESEKADKLRTSLGECGIKPKADGSYQCEMGGLRITIPAVKNPRVRVKMVDDRDEEDGEEDDDAAERH